MHTHRPRHAAASRRSWLLSATATLSIAFFSLPSFLGSTPSVYASGNPGGNVSDPVVRAADLARPAVVRIFTDVHTQLTVHFKPGQSTTFPPGGGYYTSTSTGSGAFISAHGDILTADHVVNPPHDDELSQDLDTQAAPDVADYINKHVPSDAPVTQDEVAQELFSGQLPSLWRYGKTQNWVYLSTDYSGPLTQTQFHNVPAELEAPIDRIEAQSAADAEDVAIVHADLHDTPSVKLGDSSAVHEQDMLTILGFPGNGDVSRLPTNLLTSSVNQIMVSSLKTTDQGAAVIQVSGNIEDGDSGGPALDRNGNVVGIVSFGSSSQGGTNFLQASNSAQALVQSLHLDTAPGPFEKAWSQAFYDYAASTAGHWHKAESELASIHTSYPQFKALLPYLQYALAQSPQGRVQQAQPGSTLRSQRKTTSPRAGIITAATVIIVLALAMFALTLRRRKKQPPLPPAPLLPMLPAEQAGCSSKTVVQTGSLPGKIMLAGVVITLFTLALFVFGTRQQTRQAAVK